MPSNQAWDGLSGLLERVRHRGFRVSLPTRLDPGALSTRSVVFAIEPNCALDEALLSFVRRGGWLLVADETGRLQDFWNELGIHLRPSDRRGKAVRPAATRGGHPLTRGLARIWTNRPGAFTGVRGRVLADLGPGAGTVILDISLGKGRILALSDASLFINLMLKYRPNADLLDNMLDWMASSGKSRVLLLTGSCRILSRRRHHETWVGTLLALARRLDHLAPGPDLLFVITVLLMGLALATLALRLPLAAAIYDGSWTRAPSEPNQDSFAARIEHVRAAARHDYSGPAIRLREELDRILAPRLGLSSPLIEARPDKDFLERRLGKDLARDFAHLHRLCANLPVQPGMRPVSRKRFVRLLDFAIQFLDNLQARPSWMPKNTKGDPR